MNAESILDKNFNTQIQEFLMDEEEIEWEGRPWLQSSTAVLSFGKGYKAPPSGALNTLGFTLAATLVGCYKFYSDGNWTSFVLTLITAASIMIVPEIMMNESRKNTKYSFTISHSLPT